MRDLSPLRRLLAIGLLAVAAQAQALQTTVLPTDLPDVVPGQDLWHLDIALSGDLPAFGAVEYAFPFAAFGDFALTGSVAAVFDVSATPALPALLADGLLRFTAQSSVTGGSFQFGVDIVSLAGRPGALPFTVYDTNGDIQSTGVAAVVPEPPAAWLLACGLMLAPLLARRARG